MEDNKFIEVKGHLKRKRRLVYGVGVNDADYNVCLTGENGKVVATCPYYNRWRNMLKRCYCTKALDKDPSYKETSVCAEWHIFSTFKVWMKQQDWEGKHLDKDILSRDTKVYSPSTCCFVPTSINNLLINSKCKGVYKDVKRNKYQAKININGIRTHLGRFDSRLLAEKAHLNAKSKYILSKAASQETKVKVKEALIRLVKEMNEGFNVVSNISHCQSTGLRKG